MKLAFVAHSHGNVALLEKALITLVDRYQVDRVVALETADADVEAVLRGRGLRFPAEQAPGAAGYPDFVLASVLSGVTEAPADEVARTARLRAAVMPGRGAGQVYAINQHKIGVGVTDVDLASLSVLVLTAVERRGLARDEAPVRVSPGHLRAQMHEGEPAACLVLSLVEGRIHGQFVAPDGARLGQPEILEVGRA